MTPLTVLLFAASAISVVKSSATECRFHITKHNISKSWQSSSYFDVNKKKTACFNSQTETPINSYYFFHSAVNLSEGGFHWFVIKLNEPQRIGSVSIQNRDDSDVTEHPSLNSRAADIQMWTTPSSRPEFGRHEYCNAANIERVFNATKSNSWSFCGSTKANVSKGEVLTVPCKNHKVLMVLLRKYVANETEEAKKYMSFINMWLNTIRVTTEIEPSSEVRQNSSVNITCQTSCAESDSNIQLWHESRASRTHVATGSGFHAIVRVQPNDSGNYSCRVDDDVVSSSILRVLYPPTVLQISSNISQCLESSTDVEISLESSEAVPSPRHSCRVEYLRGNSTEEMQLDNANKTDNVGSAYLKSHWLCVNCCKLANITVHCATTQFLDSGERLWNSTTSERLNSYEQPLKFTKESNSEGFSQAWLVWATGTSAAVLLILAAAVFLAKKCQDTSANSTVQSRTLSAKYQREQPLQRQRLEAEAPKNNTIEVNFSSPQDSNACTYASVMPRGEHGTADDEAIASSRPVSDITVYLEILADGT